MIYTVLSGDTLKTISKSHHISDYRHIYDHNNNFHFRRENPNPNNIRVGSKIYIPSKKPFLLHRIALEESDQAALPANILKSSRNNTTVEGRIHSRGVKGVSCSIPLVTLRFDDGTSSQYNLAFRYLQKHGIVGSLYLVGHYLDNAPGNGRISISQAHEMVSAGWEVGYHSYSHDRSWTEKKENIQSEIDPTPLNRHGFKPKTFILPYSRYKYQAIKALEKIYDGIAGIPSQTLFNRLDRMPRHKVFTSYTVKNNTTVKDIEIAIQAAVKQHRYIIFCFHAFASKSRGVWELDQNKFQAMIDLIARYCKRGDIEVVTFSEACHRLKGVK